MKNDTQDMASLKRRYMIDIDMYEREYQPWMTRGKNTVKRYRDERNDLLGTSDGDTSARYNILWSNVQTIIPAVFARLPKPEVTRRYKDKDPVARVASLIIERALQFEVEQYSDYASAVKNSIEDRVLPGRGVAWVRYEPVMRSIELPGQQITEDAESDKGDGDADPQTVEVIDYEQSPVDYINWEDFGHNVARTWEEVHLQWRCVPLDCKELRKRFGACAKKYGYSIDDIPLDMKANADDDTLSSTEGESLKKARIYEIWDKKLKRVTWLSKSFEQALDVQDDPLQLECFFPGPQPLYATITTDSLIPVPDYCQYQDQAKELDLICERINGLVDSLKVAGVYDAGSDGIQNLFKGAGNTQLIPVDSWAIFAEKGGIKGAIDWVPLDMVYNSLIALYQARDQAKQVIYEITGLSDIVRGASDPRETLGAQKMKGQFASLRLKTVQSQVADFATKLLRIKAEIICKHYQPESIKLIACTDQLPEQDQQLVDQAIQLLKNGKLSGFRIEISSDSLLEVDEQAEKEGRMELITALGQFVERAMNAPPELQPLLGEVALFAIRGFKAGKTLEGVFEETVESLKEKAKQPQQQKPDPEMMKVQAQQQMEQQRLQADQQMEAMRMQMEQKQADQQMRIDQQHAQMEAMVEQQKQQAEQQTLAVKAQLEDQFARWKAELDAATKIETANISAQVKVENAATQAATNEISSEVKQ